MKKLIIPFNLMMLLLVAITFSGCRRSKDDVWEDARTAGRHMNRGVRSFAGKHGDSRAVQSREDFYPTEDGYNTFASAPSQGDYEPLPDYQNSNDTGMRDMAVGDYVVPQPRETPGDPGSSIPGIDSFRDPSTNPELARVFKNIHFEYNSFLVKGDENVTILRDVSNYMRSHPNTYIFVEGHCCEKGPAAFNLALGARRSDAVRNQLISDGVNPDNIFTISYGKERPLVLEHHEEAWAQNRRVEFKVYQR